MGAVGEVRTETGASRYLPPEHSVLGPKVLRYDLLYWSIMAGNAASAVPSVIREESAKSDICGLSADDVCCRGASKGK